MVSLGVRLAREHNRIYKAWMRLLWRYYGMNSPMVLMVHGFKPSKETCSSAFEMTATSFERLMEWLLKNEWHPMQWGEVVRMVENKEEMRRGSKRFYVTFDDIYDTVFTESFPILNRLHIPFTVFVTKDLIGKQDFITMEHLQLLAKDPLCMIGCHGMEHKMFRYMSAEEMTHQCVEERLWLEKTFDVKVESFAYPYGRVVEVSDANRRLLPKLGFRLGFSAIEGSLKSIWWTGKYYLPRICVSEIFVEKFVQHQRLNWKDCEGR